MIISLRLKIYMNGSNEIKNTKIDNGVKWEIQPPIDVYTNASGIFDNKDDFV